MSKSTDNPRPDPPFQQTPNRGPIDPHHEPAKGDGEPGEMEDDTSAEKEAKRLEQEQKDLNKRKTVE